MKNANQISRVIIVHGWADDPAKGWIAWLTRELQARGIEVVAPAMPNPKEPKVAEWVAHLEQLIGTVDEHTVLIGHSLGVYVLLRYLNGYQGGDKLGKLVLVAGFAGHERAEHGKRALPEVDFKLIRLRVERIYNVYSNNDSVVPPSWSEQLGIHLGAKNVVDPGKGHFAGLHGCDELPSVLELITG